MSNIWEGLRNENPYCVDLHFLGVEAWQCAEGINVVPRMVDQVQHFDVCSVVNNRQTRAMTLQVKMHTNSVPDTNMGNTRITSAVNYLVWDLNPCTIFWITCRNSGSKIQSHCHCKPQGK